MKQDNNNQPQNKLQTWSREGTFCQSLSCSTNYGHWTKENKKRIKPVDHCSVALVSEIKFHSTGGRWHVAIRRVDCLNKHPSFLTFTDAGISLIWCVWHNQLVLEILVPQHIMSCFSARQYKEACCFLSDQTNSFIEEESQRQPFIVRYTRQIQLWSKWGRQLTHKHD